MKRVLSFLIACLFFLLLTGCWSKTELNDFALVTSMSVDKSEEGFKMALYVVVPDAVAGVNPSMGAPGALFTAESVNLCDAFRRLTYTISRNANLAHVSSIIISEEIARDGIVEVLDCLIRDDQLRPSVNMFIAKGMEAKDVLSIQMSLESAISTQIQKSMNDAVRNYSAIHAVLMHDLISRLVSEGAHAYIPGIMVEGDLEKGNSKDNVDATEAEAKIVLTPLAVFNKDKLVNWLDEYTSKGVNLLMGEVQSTMISIPCGEDDKKFIAFDVVKAKSKIKAKVKNEKPKVNITIKLQGTLCQVDCEMDLLKSKTINKLEKQLEDAVKLQLDHSIKMLQSYKSDVVGFGEMVHKEDPKYWKEAKKDWDKIFPELEYEILVDVIIKQPGNVLNPLIKDLK